MKKCSKCGAEKPFDEFYIRKGTGKCRADCKQCCQTRNKQWVKNNEQYAKRWKQEYNIKNKKKNEEYRKEYCRKNKKTLQKQQSEYYHNNIEERKKYRKEYYHKNREDGILKSCLWQKENQQKITRRNKKRRTEDPLYKLSSNLRSRIYHTIKNKSDSTQELIGCSWEELKIHLEKKFTKRYEYDFDWSFYIENNQQFGWHVDHIIPLASANTEEELYKLCHYTNLEFRWCSENLSKNDRIIIE